MGHSPPTLHSYTLANIFEPPFNATKHIESIFVLAIVVHKWL